MEADHEVMRRRVEAARILGGIPRQVDLAKAIGLSKQTFLRRYRGEKAWRRGELIAIAQVCEIPMWFLDSGFEGAISHGAMSEAEEDLVRDLLTEDPGDAEGERGHG